MLLETGKAFSLAFGAALGVALVGGVAEAALTVSAAAAGAEPRAGDPEAPNGLRIVAAVAVDGAPSGLVIAAGSVWVSLGVDGIVRIDPSNNRIIARIKVPGVGLAFGFGAIWAIDIFSSDLLRIEPATNRVSRRIKVRGLTAGIAVGHGSLWAANQLDSTMSRVSPVTGRTLATIQLDRGGIWPGAIAATSTGVWVVAQNGNVVNRVDPADSTVDLRIPIRGARTLAVAGGAVWVGIAGSTSLVRIGRGLRRVAVAGYRADGFGPQLAGRNALWLAAPGIVARVGTVSRRQPSLRFPRNHYLSAIAVADDIWVADQKAQRIFRLEQAPLK